MQDSGTILNFFILFQGSQVNTPIQNGRSALHIAVQSGKMDVMKYLVTKGADVNVSCLLESICEASKIVNTIATTSSFV